MIRAFVHRLGQGILCIAACLIAAGSSPAMTASSLIGDWNPQAGFDRVSVGDAHACAIAIGRAFCWGDNTYGQLGDGTTVSKSMPVRVDYSGVLAGKTVTDISAGTDHTCAVASGKAYCWGRNNFGQLGDYTSVDKNTPVAVWDQVALNGRTVTRISSGNQHTCTIAGGNVYCWGKNNKVQLGAYPTSSSYSVPATVNTSTGLSGKTITDVTAGSGISCVVASAKAYCWGDNLYGQLGDNTTTDRTTPTAVYEAGALSGKTLTAIASGTSHTCAIADSRAYCWGRNNSRKLGSVASTAQIPEPVAVNTSSGLLTKTITSISAGADHSCAVADASTYCWGLNSSGQLGIGTTTAATSPTFARAVDANGIVSAGSSSTCVTYGAHVYCTGSGTSGRLGNNQTTGIITSMTSVLSSEGLTHGYYRFYQPGTSESVPGAALGATNTPVTLTDRNQAFRVRTGILATHTDYSSIDIDPGLGGLTLQFAQKTASTCIDQVTGYQPVTNSSLIRYNLLSGTTNGAYISPSADDPEGIPMFYMNYIADAGTFSTTTKIYAGNMGIWDFSLKDNNAPVNTTYCLAIRYNNTDLDWRYSVAELKTAPPSEVSVGFVDASGASLAAPSFPLATRLLLNSCQTTTGSISTSAQRIRVSQTGPAAGWSVSMAPTNGSTASWQRVGGGTGYDFNDPSGSPAGCGSGSDGDGLAGQMTINPSNMTSTPQSGCTTTGTSLGSSANFSSSVQAITIASGSTSAQSNCFRDFYGGTITQTIPPSQPAGQYNIDMTVTAVMQ